MRKLSTICKLSVFVVLLPLCAAGQTVRADITLVDGRTVQVNRPVLEVQTNPGWTPAVYNPTEVVEFFSDAGGIRKSLRWSEVARIDYYPVDGGSNCATVLSLREGTHLGIKGSLVFDLSNQEIVGQLPSEVVSILRSARWHSEFKPLTAPSGQHHLEPYGAAKHPSVWHLLQCADFVNNEQAYERPKIKSIVFIVLGQTNAEIKMQVAKEKSKSSELPTPQAGHGHAHGIMLLKGKPQKGIPIYLHRVSPNELGQAPVAHTDEYGRWVVLNVKPGVYIITAFRPNGALAYSIDLIRKVKEEEVVDFGKRDTHRADGFK